MADKGQLTLFSKAEEVKSQFEIGEIVMQTKPFVGSFNTIFPFWQVIESYIDLGERLYRCYPIPYGVFPYEVHNFKEEGITSIGKKWKVFTREELTELCKKYYKVSVFVKSLNQSINDNGQWRFKPLLPYNEEKELVDMLKETGIDYTKVTRDNFYDAMKPVMVIEK